LLNLAYDLLPEQEPDTEQAWRATLWSGQLAALFPAAEIRRVMQEPKAGAAYLSRLIPRLVRILQDTPLGAVERAEAGVALAQLGDPGAGLLRAPAPRGDQSRATELRSGCHSERSDALASQRPWLKTTGYEVTPHQWGYSRLQLAPRLSFRASGALATRQRGICHFRLKIFKDARDSSLACSAHCASPRLGMTKGRH